MTPGSVMAWPALSTISSRQLPHAVDQRMRALRRAEHIVAALHNDTGDVLQAVRLAQQLPWSQEEVVADVVAFDDGRRRWPLATSDGSCQPCLRWRQLRKNALVRRPCLRRRHLHGGIGIGEPPQIGRQRIGALGLWQETDEIRIEVGAKPLRALDERPFDLCARAEEDGAHDEPGNPLGMRLGIRDGERRSPRAADDQPALDAEVHAYRLDVGDEMLRRVGLERQIGMAAAGAALIEQEGVEARRIEQPPMHVLSAAARAAVQEQRRDTVGGAHLLDVKPVAVADAEHARIERAQRIGIVGG